MYLIFSDVYTVKRRDRTSVNAHKILHRAIRWTIVMKHNTGIHCTCPRNQSSTIHKKVLIIKYSSIWIEKKEMQSYHCYSSRGDGTSTKIHKHLLSYHFMIFSKLFLSSIWFDICYPIFPENIPKVSILCSTFFSSYKAFLAGKRNTKIYVVWWPDDNWLSEYTCTYHTEKVMHASE